MYKLANWFMRSEQFSAIIKYQLGEPIYDNDFTCPACNQKAGKNADHAMHCTAVNNGASAVQQTKITENV